MSGNTELNENGDFMNKDAHWYGLNMLPLYVEMSDSQLDAAHEQLNNLLKMQTQPHRSNHAALERIIKLHTSQNTDNWVFFEQCKKWRDDNPNEDDLKLIARVEKSAYELEKINQEIIKLAASLKDDAKVGLEFFLKNFAE